MYRIRLSSGQEQVYRSIQELTAGVQRGEVTSEAEIYHQRTERWLSIESHPHYRMAVEGGTATRTSRLKFTRPSSPSATPTVLPTPKAQEPDKGDLEELNRLLVLLDPLPTPAQRAEPEPPAVKSPPELSIVRPEQVPPSVSEDPEPTFGTMLRLEDLDAKPDPEAAPEPELREFAPEPAGMIEDVRVLDEALAEPAPEQVAEPVMEAEVPVAPSDLGLPVEIELDEELLASVLEEAEEPKAEPATEPAPVLAAAAPVSEIPSVVPFAAPEPWTPAEAPAVAASSRRFRPMLFVAVAAILAAAVFAFTGGGDEPNQGMVTPASATAPTPAPAVTPDSLPASTQASPTAPASSGASIGFPLPQPGKPAVKSDSEGDGQLPASPLQDGGALPSAPAVDLSSTSTALVDAGAASGRTGTGGGAALARGYAQAYASLNADFAAQADRSGLVRLFSQTQLTTSDGLAGARRALDATSAAIRQYRSRESAIERAYQDSARALERGGASAADMRDWMTHISQQESAEAANESSRLLGQVDAVFALLQSQSGRYQVQGGAIRFQNSDAAARYAELQGWITRRLEHWSGQPASSIPVTVKPILEGIGLTRLPTSR